MKIDIEAIKFNLDFRSLFVSSFKTETQWGISEPMKLFVHALSLIHG